jgi:hypothetical protein
VRLDPQELIRQAVTANASVETIEKLVALAERVRAVSAREAWFEALAQFQQRCPPIPKLKKADLGSGFTYTYSPLDQVLKIVRPIMAPLGLTPRWRSGKVDAKSVSIECLLAHRLGHEESSGDVVLPIPAGGRGVNDAQRAAGAMTYAKRNALLMVSGIQPEEEDDDTSDAPGDFDHEGPARDNPTGPEAERPFIVGRVMRSIEKLKLSTEERLQIGQDFLPRGRMNEASLEDLRKLEFFLGDAAVVEQWRAERAARAPKQGEL